MLEGIVKVIPVAAGPGQIEPEIFDVGYVVFPFPLSSDGKPVYTVIVILLLVAGAGDAQVALDVKTTEITEPLGSEVVV